MPSSFGLPPLESCLGTSPNQADSCRPLSKLFASAIDGARVRRRSPEPQEYVSVISDLYQVFIFENCSALGALASVAPAAPLT